jgi:hypothetical protein
LRCPFYIEAGGLCGVHRHRDAVCSTWFCKYDRGARGVVMWTAVKQLLKQIERALRLHCLSTIDLGGTAFELAMMIDPFNKPLDDNDLRRTRNEVLYRRSWGRYFGREREFFIACAELVAPLQWSDVAPLLGVEGAATVELVRRLRRSLARLPQAVTAGVGGLVQLSQRPGMARVRHSSVLYDFVEVPSEALAALPKLESRPLADALAELRQAGLAFDEELVRTLIDYQLLVAREDVSDAAS